jgi:hypothetical protein
MIAAANAAQAESDQPLDRDAAPLTVEGRLRRPGLHRVSTGMNGDLTVGSGDSPLPQKYGWRAQPRGCQ